MTEHETDDTTSKTDEREDDLGARGEARPAGRA
jgi:hypothetical protein